MGVGKKKKTDVTFRRWTGHAGPKVSAASSAEVVLAIYTTETFTIAVVVSCFASLIVGFVSGLLYSRRCKMNTVGGVGDFSGAPYLEQRRLSRYTTRFSAIFAVFLVFTDDGVSMVALATDAG